MSHVSDLIAVALAALVGFAGNELAARYRIRTGRKIGSAALVADGLHARTDGFTSLAVLLGAGGVALGWNWADPVIGLAITVAILAVLRQAAREIYRRLMDAVDPALVDQAEAVLRATPGVLDAGQVRMRWVGHQIRAECEIVVAAGISAVQAHQLTVSAEHALLHAIPRLSGALVHADPQVPGTDPHDVLAGHRPVPPGTGLILTVTVTQGGLGCQGRTESGHRPAQGGVPRPAVVSVDVEGSRGHHSSVWPCCQSQSASSSAVRVALRSRVILAAARRQ